MLFTTPSQFIVLLILFIGGLILGLGLHPGGKKWRKRFNDESNNYAQFRRDADRQFQDSNRRIAELEQQLASRSDAPVVHHDATVADRAPIAAAAAVPAFAPTPVEPADPIEPVAEKPRKSWFSMANNADLTRIRGIDAVLESRLIELGVTRFEDITELSAEDEMALEQRLSLPAGYITREQWREQAALLRDGKEAEQADRFPPA